MISILSIIFILIYVNKRKVKKIETYEKTSISKKELIYRITFSAVFIALGAVLKTVSTSSSEQLTKTFLHKESSLFSCCYQFMNWIAH